MLEHLVDFEQSLRAKNDAEEHIALVIARIKRLLKMCNVAMMSDLSASAVVNCLATLRKEGVSVQTSNHYLRAVKQFVRWLVLDRRMAENPLAHLAALNVEVDRRRRRRALLPVEFDRLIAKVTAVRAEVGRVIVGQGDVMDRLLMSIFAGGHWGHEAPELAAPVYVRDRVALTIDERRVAARPGANRPIAARKAVP